jgi:hypothetical protein
MKVLPSYRPARLRMTCMRHLNAQVLTLHALIHDTAPEIEHFIAEMRALPADDSHIAVSPGSLYAYTQDLRAMLQAYRRQTGRVQASAWC